MLELIENIHKGIFLYNVRLILFCDFSSWSFLCVCHFLSLLIFSFFLLPFNYLFFCFFLSHFSFLFLLFKISFYLLIALYFILCFLLEYETHLSCKVYLSRPCSLQSCFPLKIFLNHSFLPKLHSYHTVILS